VSGYVLEIPAEFLEAVAERVVKILEQRGLVVAGKDEDRWVRTRDAAAHLGLSVNALYKLTAARAIPFEQDVAGGRLWFLRSELDQWRRGGGRLSAQNLEGRR
jgi:predicted DNA-binding transcriptional regulator AlpA